MKTIAEQLNVTEFPFIINDSNGNKIYFEDYNKWWIKYDYDENGNNIYHEASDGFWAKFEYDTEGNQIYYEDLNGTIIDNRNVQEESPEESFRRLIKDKAVLEFCQESGLITSFRNNIEIVLDGRIMSDAFYSELIDVINKMQGNTNYTITIKYFNK